MQVAKWGNSLAVRIPVDVARALGLKEGDDVQLRALDGGEIAVITERQRREEAMAEIVRLARPLSADYKFDRDEVDSR